MEVMMCLVSPLFGSFADLVWPHAVCDGNIHLGFIGSTVVASFAMRLQLQEVYKLLSIHHPTHSLNYLIHVGLPRFQLPGSTVNYHDNYYYINTY